MLTPKDLLRLAEFLRFALSGRRGWYFLSYVLRGRPLEVDGGLELRSQSTLPFRLRHLITKSLELMVDRCMSRGDLQGALKLLDLQGAWFVGDHFCCSAGGSLLCSPREYALALAYQVRQIFKRRIYGSPTDSLVVDIGAWVGDSSVYFARLRNRVVAVEPVAMHAMYVRLNARLNGLEDRIKVVNAAYHLTADGLDRIDLRGPATRVPGGLSGVSYVKLSEVIGGAGKVYVKADCEGCEYDLVDELVPRYVDAVYGIAMEVHKDAGDHLRLLSKLAKYYVVRKVAEDDYAMVVRLSKRA